MAQNRGVRSTSIVFPLLLIAFGVMVLLARANPNFYPWAALHRYWPLILIFVGAGMIWDRSRRPTSPEQAPPFPVGSAIGTVFAVLLLFALMWHGHAWVARHSAAEAAAMSHRMQTVETKGAKAVRMSVKMPAGNLRIDGGAEQVLEADFSYGSGWLAPTVDYTVDNGSGDLDIGQGSNNQVMIQTDNSWDLRVNDAIPLDLEVDLGAGRGEFRFAKVNLTHFQLNIGAGEAKVDLSGERAKDLQAEIHGDVGEATILLPRTVGVVATVHGGLGSIDTHGLKEEDGQYVNDAYGKSPTTIHLTINGGIGSIKLQQE
ncbi:MAG TPA: toast rack family protein [Candidatus Eisenbacteria bacterium]|nr:toast rack family protein [Candidatus Eisenbacteria bacterium]